MKYRTLGKSDVLVSPLCMGCWALAGGNLWGPQDEADAIAALHAAVDLGINFFDTAEAYGAGRSEQLIRKAFKGRAREDVVIATKVSSRHLRPADVRTACENSLRNLGVEMIDVYYIHWPRWDVPLVDTLGEMARLKEEGKIRVVGCSNFGKRDLADILSVDILSVDILSVEAIPVDQLAYSLLFRAIEYEVLPLCLENDVSVACYSPLMHGMLTGKFATLADVPDERARSRHFSPATRPMVRHAGPGAEAETAAALANILRICDEAGLPVAQASLAWLLQQPGVGTVIVGARNPAQIRANAAAATLALPGDVLAALTQATEALKAKLGPNPDMWQVGERARIR